MLIACAFCQGTKSISSIDVSGDVGCTYKTGFVLQHNFREGLVHAMRDLRLDGEIEINGGWFGGYNKPENVKINRVERRPKQNQNGERRVVVGTR
jgi:hypothetical protein